MIVGLGHQARVGKDTAAQILVDKYGFTRLAFADRLKEMALSINPLVTSGEGYEDLGRRPLDMYWRLDEIVDRFGFEASKQILEVRSFLQKLGVAAREHLGDDVWVKVVLDQISTEFDGRYVVTDVRFPNEFSGLWRMGAVLIKLTRPEVGSNAGSHISETALNEVDWEYTIANDGTLEDLEAKLVKTLGL